MRSCSAVAPRFQPGDVGDDHAPEPRSSMCSRRTLKRAISSSICSMKVRLRANAGQALVRRDARRIDGGGAGGDQRRIEGVVLGPPPMQTGIGFDLARLKHKNREAGLPQMADHALLVAAGRLDPDPVDAGLAQFRGQPPPAAQVIVHPPARRSPIHRHVELQLGRIDPGRQLLVSAIFVDPCLVKRTNSSGNHPGPMKALVRSRYDAATMAQGGLDPITSRPAADGRPRQGVPFGTPRHNRVRYYKGGQSA